MARVKARHLEPQKEIGYHGAIVAIAETDMPAGSLVVASGILRSGFSVRPASNSSIRLSSGLLYITRNRVEAGNPIHCYTYSTLPLEETKKDGEPVWLGRDGKWTFTKPKSRAIQVGKAVKTGFGMSLLLAPQGRY
jgi:hypothetical protein